MPEPWVWYRDPGDRFEIALPGYPSVGRMGVTTQLSVQLVGASFSVLVTDPLSPGARTTRTAREVAASLLARLSVEHLPEPVAWEQVPGGLAWTLPDTEVRTAIVDDVALVLVANDAKDAGTAFLGTFASPPMVPTRVAVGPAGHTVLCPSRCGPDHGSVVLGTEVVEAVGLSGMVGAARYRALSLAVPEGRTAEATGRALVGSMVGDSYPLDDEGDGLLRFRAGDDRLTARIVEREHDVAAVLVMAPREPAWGASLLASLR